MKETREIYIYRGERRYEKRDIKEKRGEKK